MSDQLYLVRGVIHEADGERLGVVQITRRDQKRAEEQAAKHFKKWTRIISVEPKTEAEIQQAIHDMNAEHPARPSIQELTGGEPIRLLAEPDLADPETHAA